MGFLKPIIQEELEFVEITSDVLFQAKECEERVQGILFQNINIESEDLSHLIVSGTKFLNCRFWNCSFERAEFTDIVFQSCDLSGSNFQSGYFSRVIFESCKAVGTKFTETRMHQITIDNCSMNYANFDNSVLKGMAFENTELNSSNISQCHCKDIVWKNTGLINASFFKTSLYGMDFTDCTINGLVLSDDSSELRGVIVDIYQAAELAKRLGVTIK